MRRHQVRDQGADRPGPGHLDRPGRQAYHPAEWAGEWFPSNEHRWRPRTIERNRLAIWHHLVPRLGHMEPSAVSPRVVQAVVNDFVAKDWPMTVRGYYSTTMMAHAVEMDVIGRSPCRGLRLRPAKAVDRQVVTPDQLRALADAVGQDWRALIYLAGVDLPGPLRLELAAYVERAGLDDPDALLFADYFGGPLRRSNFRRGVFSPAAYTAGVDGLTFHGLRHSAATTWMAAGADVRTVQHLLGHSDLRLVLRLYAHVANDAVKRGAETASRLYWHHDEGAEIGPDVP